MIGKCPVCESLVKRWVSGSVPSKNKRFCPVCQSKPRHRMVWLYMEQTNSVVRPNTRRILHVAPEACLVGAFTRAYGSGYYTCDLDSQRPGVQSVFSIENIPFGDEYFDFIICNHVLEHVANDRQAMSEFARVLRPDGMALVTIPIQKNRDNTYEDFSITAPEDRAIHFGQQDHVRSYGADAMIRLAGNNLFARKYCGGDFPTPTYYGLRLEEPLFVFSKCFESNKVHRVEVELTNLQSPVTPHFMMPLSPAANAFEKARLAFDAGDYGGAVLSAREAELLVSPAIRSHDYDSASNPAFSIIIVIFGRPTDVAEALKELAVYSNQDSYELILVNNGTDAYQVASGILNRFRWIDVGFNYGCSGGRNLGAKAARGDFVIFLDDDGRIEKGAVECLIKAITEHHAVAVRGRVRPKTPGGIIGGHYDYGEEIINSVPNVEGLSIWHREAFIKHGGFDTLLAGHEGLAICSKMYPFYGQDGFLYTPHAVLLHDYAMDAEELAAKRDQRQKNRAYLEFSYPSAAAVKATIDQCRNEPCTRALVQRAQYRIKDCVPRIENTQQRLSVLTVGGEGVQCLKNYTDGLKSQTHTDFDLIFVDNDPSGATGEQLSLLWLGDERLRLVKGGRDRSTALNLAVANADSDICLIAEVNDISLPRRFELTLCHLLASPQNACLSFTTFNEKQIFVTPHVDAFSDVGMRTRCLLGMPAAFGAFAFRKSRFNVPFDAALNVGCECSWIYENFRHSRLDGTVIPSNQVFCQDLVDQLGLSHLPRAIELDCIFTAYQDLAGSLSQKEKHYCQILSGLSVPDGEQFADVKNYVMRIIANNAKTQIYDQREVEHLLLQRLAQIEKDFLLIDCQKEKQRYLADIEHIRSKYEKLKQKKQNKDGRKEKSRLDLEKTSVIRRIVSLLRPVARS